MAVDDDELEIVMERLPLTLAMLCATHAVDLHCDGRGRVTIVAVVRDAPPGALCRRGVGRTVDAALADLDRTPPRYPFWTDATERSTNAR